MPGTLSPVELEHLIAHPDEIESHNKKVSDRIAQLNATHKRYLNVSVKVKTDDGLWQHPFHDEKPASGQILNVATGKSCDISCRYFIDVCTRMVSPKPFSVSFAGISTMLHSQWDEESKMHVLEPFKDQGGLPWLPMQCCAIRLENTELGQHVFLQGEQWLPRPRYELVGMAPFRLISPALSLEYTYHGSTFKLDTP